MHARFLHEPLLWLLALLATAAPAPLAAQAAAVRAPTKSGYALPAPERIRATRDYIRKTWTTWTNGVYLELLAGLEAPSEPRRR